MKPTSGQTRPPCPINLAAVADEQIIAGLPALAVGAAVRLIRYAWQATPACHLPASEASLAAVAGVTSEEWARLQSGVLLALGAVQHNGGASPSLLVLPRAETAYRHLLARAEAVSRQRAAAGRGNRQAPDERAVNGPSTGRQRAVQKPVSDASVGALRAHTHAREAMERSEIHMNQERSSAPSDKAAGGKEESPGEQLAGAIYARLEADAGEARARWGRQQVLLLLTDAVSGWARDGRITFPDGRERGGGAAGIARVEAAKLANYPHVTPCAVAIALARIRVRDEEAKVNPNTEAIARPLSWLIGAVGAKRGGRTLQPALHEQGIVDAWAKRERAVFDAERVKAAAASTAMRIDAAMAERSGRVDKWHSGQVKGA